MTIQFSDIALLLLRVFLGIIFLVHALPKFSRTAEMAAGMKKTKTFVFLLGIVEFLAALVLILGFYTKIGAAVLSIVMLGALYYKIFKWKVPFSPMHSSGWEFDLALLGANIVLVALGAGAISFDSYFGFGI